MGWSGLDGSKPDSAIPLTADIPGFLLAYLSKVPRPDLVSRASTTSFDHLVGHGKQRRWNREVECLGRLEVDAQLELIFVNWPQNPSTADPGLGDGTPQKQ